MTTEISTSVRPQLPSSPHVQAGEVKDLVKSFRFVPRLQLCGSMSDAVKDGKIGLGRYAIISGKDDPVIDLGSEVSCTPLSFRLKAMQLKGTKSGRPISKFDPSTEEFKRMQAASSNPNSGYLYGIEVLLFVPDHGFATFYMASKSAQGISAEVVEYLSAEKNITLGCKLAKNSKGNKWHAPTVSICSSPLADPDWDLAKSECAKFANQPDDIDEIQGGGEQASAEEAASTSRER